MPDVLTRSLADIDPEVQAAVAAELRRQQETLEMIASENFAPRSRRPGCPWSPAAPTSTSYWLICATPT